MSSDFDRRRRARWQAEARYSFRWHLPIYLLVNLGLVGIWYYTGGGLFWPAFPIVFWGLGVIAHYFGAYHSFGRSGTLLPYPAHLKTRGEFVTI